MRGPRRLERHVHELADAHGIEVVVKERTRAAAISRKGEEPRKRQKVIRIEPIRGQVSYLTALHELGHHLHRGRSLMRRLDSEGAAWEWALDNSLVEPTPATWGRIFARLNSYAQWSRRHATARREEDSPVFLRMVDRALRGARDGE